MIIILGGGFSNGGGSNISHWHSAGVLRIVLRDNSTQASVFAFSQYSLIPGRLHFTPVDFHFGKFKAFQVSYSTTPWYLCNFIRLNFKHTVYLFGPSDHFVHRNQ